jgi:pimeloyl-ACP methyl ester carboxylesterase
MPHIPRRVWQGHRPHLRGSGIVSGVTDRDLQLPSGRVRLRTWDPGSPDGDVPVLCVHALSSTVMTFHELAPALAAAGRRVHAFDLRGRGHSEDTGLGTYGWHAHARDVLDLADALGVPRFDLLGHSLGAYVSMIVAAENGDRVRRLALVDGAGRTEPETVEPVTENLGRLDRWHDSEEEYLALMRAGGLAVPWSEAWEAFYRYELDHADDGAVRSRTSLPAVLEDISFGGGFDQSELWPQLVPPTLLVRATRPLGDGGGFVINEADRDRFASSVPDARVVEVDANHFGVVFHAGTVAAVVDFLR